MKRVAIIGTGASGLACASSFTSQNIEIILLEQYDKTARKLLATGNGRCNISNTEMTMDFYNTTNPIIENIIINFDVIEFFKQRGLFLKQEGTLLYPFSNQAKSVKDCLLKKSSNVSIIKNNPVVDIKQTKDGYLIQTTQNKYLVDYVVLAIGSKAGSMAKDTNYQLLQQLHIPTTSLHPSLVAFETKKVYKQLKGVRVKGSVTLLDQGKQIKTQQGEIQFTDYGISGICVMQLSRFFHQCTKPQVQVDLLPQYTQLEAKELIEQFSYAGIFPDKLVEVLQNNSISVKNWIMDLKGTKSFPNAQVVQGGIPLEQINKDLELKQYNNMFAIGEVLDVDGDCGGYNLHFAFGSGQHVASIIEERVKKC